MNSVLQFILSRRRDGDARAGVIVLVVALLVFLAALAFSSGSSYGATVKPPRKAKVKASVHRGQLNVLGTARSDRITLRLKPGNPSRLQVDVGSDGRAEHTFKRSSFSRIVLHGGRGIDAITVDESFGAFTNAEATSVFGDAGSDLVVGKGSNAAEKFELAAEGSRLKYSRNGSAVRVAGVERFDVRALGGSDSVVARSLAGSGLGKLNLDPGADSDSVVAEGTAGNDVITVSPAAIASHIAVSTAVPIDVVNSEALAVESLGGNDTLSGAVGLAALTKLTLDGGAGNDTINGGDGADILRGGTENDAIDGNRGDDIGLLGAGDDSFTWDPGDGSDKVEGESGTDTLVFNGAAVAENFDLSANGNRLKFFRNVANITMDVDDTERVDLRALGGIDNTVVNDLSATDVKSIDLDLATDGAIDTTTVNGSPGNDAISIAPNAGAVDVTGLAAALRIRGSEAANDVLDVNGLGGNDTINGAVGLAALIKVGTLDGGTGNDTINGGDGAETLQGGDGNDALDGNRGNDTGFLGAGDDSFRWDPGDGSDVVEGQDGADTLLFNGAGVAENFDISAVGERVRFFRDVANIVMDLNDVEEIDTQALGGPDKAVVNDVTGTGLKHVSFDVGAFDGAADSITVTGTNDADDIQIRAQGTAVDVDGPPAEVVIDHSEAANDKLTVNGLAGPDTITAEPGVGALIQLELNGGPDADVLTGGDGADRIAGQQGADQMFGGAGNDTLVWNPGDGNDLIEGQAGAADAMEFNGAAGAEVFEASAVGGRLRFTRNLGNIVMDVGSTEVVTLAALGGADSALFNDLTGTGVIQANVDLAAALGGNAGDGAADLVTINGTDGPDNIDVAATGGVVDVSGLSTAVAISHSEAANDTLAVKALGGDDDVAVGAGVAGLIQPLVDLGAGE